MTDQERPKGLGADLSKLPAQWPTNKHTPQFWEALGRAVGTFGFLEEVLGKAIFAITAMRHIPVDAADEALEEWWPTIERALTDPLGGLVDMFGKAVREDRHVTISNLDQLLGDLRQAVEIRNVVCHGSWRHPDEQGRSLPFFVNRKQQIFNTPIDAAFLEHMRLKTVELAFNVIGVVTFMGRHFPDIDTMRHPSFTAPKA